MFPVLKGCFSFCFRFWFRFCCRFCFWPWLRGSCESFAPWTLLVDPRVQDPGLNHHEEKWNDALGKRGHWEQEPKKTTRQAVIIVWRDSATIPHTPYSTIPYDPIPAQRHPSCQTVVCHLAHFWAEITRWRTRGPDNKKKKKKKTSLLLHLIIHSSV